MKEYFMLQKLKWTDLVHFFRDEKCIFIFFIARLIHGVFHQAHIFPIILLERCLIS